MMKLVEWTNVVKKEKKKNSIEIEYFREMEIW